MSLVELKKQCDKLVPACSSNFVECLKNKNIYYLCTEALARASKAIKNTNIIFTNIF